MDHWTRIITAGIGPIIVISACGLLCLAFYNRLAAVVTRLRAFHREHMHEQDEIERLRRSGGDETEVAVLRRQEVLGMLSLQIEQIDRRARLIRCTLMCLLLTIALLALCSIAVGLSTLQPGWGYVAVPLFVLGLLLVVAAVAFAMLELKGAIDPVEREGRFIRQFNLDFAAAEGEETAPPSGTGR